MAVDRMPFGALLLLFTGLLSGVLLVDSALDISKKKITLRKLNMCKGKEDLPMRWSNVVVRYNEDKETVFGLTLKVLEEVSNNFSMSFNFFKCDASGNPDSCEYVVKDYTNKEICKNMVRRGQLWSVFMEHFDKPLRCPIKVGDYQLINCPVSPDFLKYLPIGDAVWKIRLWGYDNDVAISCVDMEMQIAPFLGGRRRPLG